MKEFKIHSFETVREVKAKRENRDLKRNQKVKRIKKNITGQVVTYNSKNFH